MELRLFSFIEEVTEHLEKMQGKLEIAVTDLELFFHEILLSKKIQYSNINSRVKSCDSLKEKIIRNTYYKKYGCANELFSNLSDLIGIRIECRFGEDEGKIYKALKEYFDIVDDSGYCYNQIDDSIKLELSSPQPQNQKNGFKIYRIDGYYLYAGNKINFEVQIKSLVNSFWGEIEHKVVYKNNNYIVDDTFIKNILGSIKKNLAMIDNQLLMIDNQYNKMNSANPDVRMIELESVLSKMIYDIFSTRMKNNLGFIVEFRNSCDTIMKYIFRTNKAENLDDYNKTLIKTLTRLNDISKNTMDFDSEIKFERKVKFKDEFSSILGNEILKSINTDFEWNLFFRILFEIELGNNAEDFEKFISFIKNRYYSNKNLQKLKDKFDENQAQYIIDELIIEIAKTLKKVDSVKYIYDNNVEKTSGILKSLIEIICKDIKDFNKWQETKKVYIEFLNLEIVNEFEINKIYIEYEKFIEEIRKIYNETKEYGNILKLAEKKQR